MKILDYKELNRSFPQLPEEFPSELLSEEWARNIHGQTLKRLNERGGLTVRELLLNLKQMSFQEWDKKYLSYRTNQSDVDELLSYITANKNTPGK